MLLYLNTVLIPRLIQHIEIVHYKLEIRNKYRLGPILSTFAEEN
jgi:hypothetical protein